MKRLQQQVEILESEKKSLTVCLMPEPVKFETRRFFADILDHRSRTALFNLYSSRCTSTNALGLVLVLHLNEFNNSFHLG